MSDSMGLEAFNLLPVSFWLSAGRDDDYKIVLWNKGAEEIYGYTAEEAVGKSYIDLFVEGPARKQSMIDADALIDGDDYSHPINCLAIDNYRADSKKEIILLTNVFRYEWEGKGYQAELGVNLTPSGFLEFLDDSYRNKRIKDNKQARTLKAFTEHTHNATRRMLGLWTRSYTHEVKTFVALQKISLDSLAEEIPQIRESEFYKSLSYATRELTTLADNYLRSHASDLGLQQRPRYTEPLPLQEVVDEVVDRYTFPASTKGIEFHILRAKKTVLLSSAPAQFLDTLALLVNNAVKHFDERLLIKNEEPKIIICIAVTRHSIKLEITNKGKIDTSKDYFEASYRNENTPLEGIHLGLSIAMDWVRESKGELKISQKTQTTVAASLKWPRE